MSRLATAACALAALAFLQLGGCQKSDDQGAAGDSSYGTMKVAVVDMDKMATDLGWMHDMQENLQGLQKQMQADLQHDQEMYQAELQSKKMEFAPNPDSKLTAQQQQILQGMQQVAEQVLKQLQQAANQRFNEYRQQCVAQYRDAVRPLVREVAEDKHLWVVVEKGPNVLYSDPATDITDAVVDAARARPPTLQAVPLPTLPGPPTIQVNTATQPTTRTATEPATAPAAP